MYYIAVSEDNENKLLHYCRVCGNKDEEYLETSVLTSTNTTGEKKYNYTINEYTKYDPTLPRIYNMECPNENCKSNQHTSVDDSETDKKHKKKNPEIIYMRYDDDNLKYSYICVDCDFVWKTNTV
jgi:hypothetical protein